MLLAPLALVLFFVLHGARFDPYFFSWSDVLKALLIGLPGAAILTGIARLIFGSWSQAAVFTTIFLITFLFYRPIYLYAENIIPNIRHRMLIGFLCVFWLAVFSILWKLKPRHFATYLTTTFLALAAYEIFMMGIGANAVATQYRQIDTEHQKLLETAGDISFNKKPNVLHILLDAYTSSSSLDKYLNFKNDAFEDELTAMGFKIAKEARTNYNYTPQTMSSVFNYNYINASDATVKSNHALVALLRNQIEDNRMLTHFEKNGYLINNLSLFDLKNHPRRYNCAPLISASDTWFFLYRRILPGQLYKHKTYWDSHRITQTLNQDLSSIKLGSPPQFIYAHFLIPHSPFIYEADGSLRTDAYPYTPENYVEQVKYTNLLVLTVLKKLIAQDPNLVVILQGDHGARVIENVDQEYTSFQAIRLPEVDSFDYAPDFHNVNTYRLFLNGYGGANLPMLEYKRQHLTGATLNRND